LTTVWEIKWRRKRWAGHVACMEKKRTIHRFLVGQPEEKRSCGERMDKENDDIEVQVKETG